MLEYSYPGIQSIECTFSMFNLPPLRNRCVAEGRVRYTCTPGCWHLTLYAGFEAPTAIKNQE